MSRPYQSSYDPMRVIETTYQVVRELPGELSAWTSGLDDPGFSRIMIVGAILLTFVLARALR